MKKNMQSKKDKYCESWTFQPKGKWKEVVQSFANSRPCGRNYHVPSTLCVYKRCYTYTHGIYTLLGRTSVSSVVRFTCPYSVCKYTDSNSYPGCVCHTRYHEEDSHPLFLYTRIRCFCLRVQEVKLVSTTCLFIPTLPCSYAQSVCLRSKISRLLISYFSLLIRCHRKE